MRWWKYDYILRPNFELYACLGWIAGIGATLYLVKVCDYPAAVFQIMILDMHCHDYMEGLGGSSARQAKPPHGAYANRVYRALEAALAVSGKECLVGPRVRLDHAGDPGCHGYSQERPARADAAQPGPVDTWSGRGQGAQCACAVGFDERAYADSRDYRGR